ncbi:MAG: hypothetical protein JWO88_2982 [Frankiales bacterium]|nr:hypothetical protein [Frankiales bacterium]
MEGTTVVVVLAPTAETAVTIPPHVSQYTIDACGAAGGDSSASFKGGFGARVTSTIPIPASDQNASTQLTVVAGAPGSAGVVSGAATGGHPSGGSGISGGGGGGGFSGVFRRSTPTPVTPAQADAIVVAGAGGGASLSGNGGAGGSSSSIPGMVGESATAPGGGGGGGGYNGGAAGTGPSAGAAGGSDYPTGLATDSSTVKPGAVVISYATPRPPTFASEPIVYDQPAGLSDTWTVTIDASPVATLSLSATPTASITFTDNHDNTGSFQISPTTPIGSYIFMVHATNELGSTSLDQQETFTIRSPSATTSASPSATATGSMTASPSTSATPSASATPSRSASPCASASATPSGSATPSASATSSGSATPTATIAPCASRSATPSASRSATPTATISALHLSVSTPDIQPGQQGRLHLTAPPSSSVQLFCYSRPSTQYQQVRPSTLGQALTVGSGGSLDFTVLPGTNTRCKAQYKNDTASGSNSAVINVHTTLSLSAYRDGVRRYHFQGRNLPRLAGQLITLYGIDRSGHESRTATTHTDTSGTWRINRQFTGSGTFRFVARTSRTLTNAAGRSNVRLTIIH